LQHQTIADCGFRIAEWSRVYHLKSEIHNLKSTIRNPQSEITMRFNSQTAAQNRTTNAEGAKAYVLSPELELYTAVVTSALNDTFYESNDHRLLRIRALIGRVEPEFVAKLAVYAREQMYLRSLPLVLTVELAKIVRGNDLMARLTCRVVQRADELTELLSYYQSANGRTDNTSGAKKLNKLSKQLQKGLGAAFNKFDEYQFGKYNRDSCAVKLRDALILTHPKPKNEAQQAIFNKIVTGTLATPYTWETELSALGQQKFESPEQKQAAFQQKWQELIDSGKLGYMALMRNLRNILQARVSSEHLDKICETLANPAQVAKAKQFPFRYLSAYRELQLLLTETAPPKTAKILIALEQAIRASVVNFRGLGADERVVIACDVSGSMYRPISAKSTIQMYDIGLVLGMLLQSRCQNVVTGMFGSIWKSVILPKEDILKNVQDLGAMAGEVGYATNGYLVISDLIAQRYVADKVMIFTDVQLWNSVGGAQSLESEWLKYRKNIAPNAKLYLFDLTGHGNTPLDLSKNNGVALISGWSDKIFDVLQAVENGISVTSAFMRMDL
jgi:60 kDa SS-A/Ro ribonucleoprotein